MTRKAALNLAGDVVDIISLRLDRIESLATAIHLGCNECMESGKLICLASLAEDEAQRAHVELVKWFEGLSEQHQ